MSDTPTIPSLDEILGSVIPPVATPSAAPAASAPTAPVGVVADRSSADITRLNAEVAALRSAPQLDTSKLVTDAITAALTPRSEPTKFDPFGAVSPEAQKEYATFINPVLRPAMEAYALHMRGEFDSALGHVRKEHEAFREQVKSMGDIAALMPQVRASSIESAVRASNPNYDHIKSDPAYEAFLDTRAPVVGIPYRQVLEYSRNSRDIADTVASYNDVLAAFNATGNRTAPASGGLSDLSRPRTVGAGVAPTATGAASVEQEMAATQKAIDNFRAKGVRTEAEMTTLNRLYDRLKAFEVQRLTTGAIQRN